jgi:nitrogen fixation protein NifU and related proteins
MDEALAQEVLLDHFKKPRRRGEVPGAALRREGVNPACGDRVELTGALKDGRWELMARGSGCVISQASASMLAEALQGREAAEAAALAREVALWVTGRGGRPALIDSLEDLEALEGVRRHPARAKCAGLAWSLFLEGEK